LYASAAVLPFLDNTSDEFAADPHGVLRRTRESSWIVETPSGFGVLTYEACNAVLVDPGFRPGVFELMRRASPDAPPARLGRTLLGSEGTDHRELRRVVAPWFTPRRIETLRVQTAALAADLVDRAASAGGCEFMDDVARHIPATVFCWMVGCDIGRGSELAEQSAIALQAFSGDASVMDDVGAAIRRLRQFADELIEEKRACPGDDVTSALVAGVDRGVLSHRDARSLLTELLSASVDNTMHSMGLAVWLLAEHPEQWEQLVREPRLIEGAVEECARYEPPIRHGNHVSDEGGELLGFAVPAGTLVTVFLASAHRDPSVYPDPDRFDVARRLGQPQLSFGLGRHFCIGAALARMEIHELLRVLTTRWSSVRVGPGARVETALAGVVRELPLEFEPVRF
jgi:cytochrome P450